MHPATFFFVDKNLKIAAKVVDIILKINTFSLICVIMKTVRFVLWEKTSLMHTPLKISPTHGARPHFPLWKDIRTCYTTLVDIISKINQHSLMCEDDHNLG